MKKFIGIGLFIILCTGLLSGCSQQTDVETSTVFIEKKGSVVSVDVEKFDKDYYEAEELETYIEKQVDEYDGEDGSVEKSSFDVKDGVAKLKMRYGSYEDYEKFNGIEFYIGSVVTAQAEGYDFDTEFYSVSEDFKEKKTVDSSEVMADDDNKVAVIKANVDVQVPGKILFVSAQDTKVTAEDTVSITGKGANEEAALTYIIYQ